MADDKRLQELLKELYAELQKVEPKLQKRILETLRRMKEEYEKQFGPLPALNPSWVGLIGKPPGPAGGKPGP